MNQAKEDALDEQLSVRRRYTSEIRLHRLLNLCSSNSVLTLMN
jgi:hypothetical protein